MFIGHVSCARCNLVKTRACQEPISFRNFVIVIIMYNSYAMLNKLHAGKTGTRAKPRM